VLIRRSNLLSFKRKQQTPQKSLSRFISHLYTPPKRQQRERPRIQIPQASEEEDEYDLPDIEVHADGNIADDYADQGYAKQTLMEWVPEAGIGARKYDDLTAIGMISLRCVKSLAYFLRLDTRIHERANTDTKYDFETGNHESIKASHGCKSCLDNTHMYR
jgi:hypothetical protein